jgi:hypothetical protein
MKNELNQYNLNDNWIKHIIFEENVINKIYLKYLLIFYIHLCD